MLVRNRRVLLVSAALWVCCALLPAQAAKSITIRILDGRTGKALVSSNINVRVNHRKTEHPEWVEVNEDGTGKTTLPADATEIMVHATYDNTMEVYVNCDGVKDKDKTIEHWYSVSAILASGVTSPNGCSTKKAVAKPGELIFYVRTKSWLDRYQQDYTE